MGRGRGRVRQRELNKAFSRGAAVAAATANHSGQIRTHALGDLVNALTGGRMGSQSHDGTMLMRDMPRDPRDNVAFGPGNALAPAPLDPARPDTGRPEPRLNEYPVAWNIPGQSNRLVPWSVLRQAADGVDIMRRCISVRQEQLQGLEWSFVLDEQTVQDAYATSDGSRGRRDLEAEMRRKFLPEIQRLTQFWRYPWSQMGLSLEQWVNGLMEDHLVLDAVAVYPRVTYGGDVIGFELIDPTTIKLLIDSRGSRPQSPFPAYQQDLWGFPRGEFTATTSRVTNPDGSVTEIIEPGMTADQLFYFRENFRTWTPYGYSAVEQALISARLYLKRQGWMLAEYEDGSTPLTWLVPDGKDGNLVDALNYKTRRQWEDSINDELSGQTRARHRVKVGIPGMTPVQMDSVDERYKPEYDMHLIKMLAGHFGVTSSGLGFSEAKGLGNSGLHEGQASVQEAATTKPDTRMVERIINELSRIWLKMPTELKFKYTDPKSEDAKAEDDAANSQRMRATITVNEDRQRLGYAPIDIPEGDALMLISGNTAMPLEGMLAKMEEVHKAEQQALSAQTAASEAALSAPAEEEAGPVEKAAELSALARWRRKRGGAAGRQFLCKALEPGDFTGGVPADVDFAGWVWVADHEPDDMIVKDYSAWWPRDSKGRWVKRGGPDFSAGPANPGNRILAGLREQGEKDRAARAAAARQVTSLGESSTVGGMTTPEPAAPRTDRRPRVETYKGRKLKVQKHPRLEGRLLLTINGEMAGTPYSGRPEKMDEELAQLRRDVDAADLRRHQDPNAYPEHMFRGAPKPTPEEVEHARAYWARENADRAALRAPVDALPSRAERADQLRAGMAAALGGGPVDPNSMGERIRRAQEEDVREVIESLAGPGGWAAMADVRRRLAERGFDRGQQDAVLRRMATEGDRPVVLSPEENQKTLTDADHAAAIDLGAGPQHVVMIEPKRKSVLDAVRESAEQAAAARSVIDSVPGLREGVARQQGTASERAKAKRLDDARAKREEAAAFRERVRSGMGLPSSADDGPVVVRQAADSTGYALPTTPPAARPATEAEATAHADRLKAEYDAAQSRAYEADDAAYDADRNDAALNAAAVTAQAEADRKRREYDAAETDLNDRFIAPRMRAEREAKDRRMHDAIVAANEARERAAAESVARQERERQQAELAAAMREQEAAERRAMFISRTPDGYASLLGGRASVMGHAPSRKLVEAMRDQDWKLVGMVGSSSRWEASDGRKIELITQPGGKVAAYSGAYDNGMHGKAGTSMKAAHEYVGVGRPGAARAEAVVGATPDAPMSAAEKRELSRRLRALDAEVAEREAANTVGLSKRQRDLAAQFDRLAGEHATDPSIAPLRERAIDLTGQMEQVGRGALAQREADAIREQMNTVQDEFTHAMAGARAAAEVRAAGGDERAAKIANTRATLDSRARKTQKELELKERQIKDYTGEARKVLRERINELKAERQRYLDRIESAERDYDTKLVYDADGRLSHLSYEPPAPAATPDAPSVNDMMRAQMNASVAGGGAPAYGSVKVADIKAGTRMIYGGHVVEALGPAKPSRSKDGGWTVRVRREDQGIEGTMRIGGAQSGAPLAAPKPPKGGGRPKADAASAAPVEPLTRGAALAAAPKDVEASGARGIDRAGTAAIERYRGKSFTEINRELRAGTPSAATARTAEQLDRIMDESRLTSPVVVHRGIGDVEAVFGDAARRKLTGAEWTDAAPQSTTTDPDVADRFRVSEQGQRTTARMEIRVPAGVGAVQLSDERYEAELLLQRGLRMRVVSDTGPWRRGQKSPRMIVVEVVPE